MKLGAASLPHHALVTMARSEKQALVDRLQSGSRDYVVIRETLERFIAYQHSADVVSGQVPYTKEI